MGRENLVLLWLNALELSPAQMKSLLSLVDEVLPLRNDIVAMPEKFHEDLLRFTGTSQELRTLLSAYQKELREKLVTLENKFVAGLKRILTVAQWERLQAGIFQGLVSPPRLRDRGVPRTWFRAPRIPELRVDLLRGMTLVRLLPDLREVLAAKIEVLGN